MPFRALDVVRDWDGTAGKPKWRMLVCVNPYDLWFYRINTRDTFRPCIALSKLPHHDRLLDHDSFIEVNLLEFDDFGMTDATVVGRVHHTMIDAILAAVDRSIHLSEADKTAIRDALNEERPAYDAPD